MTLDISFGKIVFKIGKIDINEDGEGSCNADMFLTVEDCPDEKENVCNPEYTLDAKSPWRSGSTEFWHFFSESKRINKIYHLWRNFPESNDRDVCFVKPVLELINELTDSDVFNKNEEVYERNKDRLKWLKFWANKSVELYGEYAGVEFS